RIKYICGDFFDDYTLEKLVKGMDVVYHAICTLNPGNSNDKCIVGYERDFVQTAKLCYYLKDTDCRMIFFSSGGTVYGNQEKQPILEDAVPVPINHYGNLKLCIENTIRTFNFQMKKNMLVARISNPYGPGQDYHKGVGFIDAALKHAIAGETIEIWGDGSVVRDYIYIDDLCRMLYALIDYHGEIEVFNLSSNTGVSQNDIVEILKGIVPEVKVEYKPGRSVDAKKVILDNSRIHTICDMQMVSIEEGVKKYYEYIKENAAKAAE
ncbi:MAG: NAD-dependent epimerase/dehydratase family protein, partial [Lachnospiraceae bacterium]|nr:NAD-dependent epimerase/dehydratase family protein [Lachnospiraceae bacterium]